MAIPIKNSPPLNKIYQFKSSKYMPARDLQFGMYFAMLSSIRTCATIASHLSLTKKPEFKRARYEAMWLEKELIEHTVISIRS
jgi:hypothetical protein